MTVVLIAIGAAVGAPLRYLTDRFLQTRLDSSLPWGTLAVNVVGSLLLGLIVGAQANPAVTALAGTGLCGALTTYSTFGYETMRLAQDGARFYAAANVVANVAAGLTAAFVGVAAGAAFA
jgi:CrcB protein